MKFKGVITALITPFLNHKIDETGIIKNIEFQLAQKVNGILLLGTTGEAATLTSEEKKQVISLGVKTAKGKIPIWIGTGAYSTQQTIENTLIAEELGADVALIVTPYYNKPTQEGIYRHFEAIAHQTHLPIVVYNIPGRCSVNIETSTLLKIAALPNIMGVKESYGNINQTSDIVQRVLEKFPQFLVLSGDDIMTLPMIALGAQGIVSVASNLIPDKIVALTQAALSGDLELARSVHYELLPLFKALFIETNPVPIKTAMQLCHMPSGGVRLPLYEMHEENRDLLHGLLKKMNLIPHRFP